MKLKTEMKTRTLFQACMLLVATLLTAGCANDDTVHNEQQGTDNISAGTTLFSGNIYSSANTRTAILDHTKGAGAKVNWSTGDQIWVKDDGNTWRQSGAANISAASNNTYASFVLTGTYTGASHDVIYTNKPISGTQPQVEIKSTQTQSAPNNFDHAGASGDFAIAKATKPHGRYEFTLDHKVAYLCLIPRSSNEYVHHSKLTKVEIESEDDIAGTYNIATDGTLTLASGGSKTITLTTGSGFDVTNTADDMSKNAAYAVIAPGNHKLRIRYWLKNDVDGVGPTGAVASIEGTVTKYVTMNFDSGKIHDITANLDPKDYDGDHYYLWDAKEQYWHGYEWTHGNALWQTTKPSWSGSSFYPKSKTTDPDRWCNDSYPGDGVRNDAQTPFFQSLPNANELAWYVMKGNPCWDKDELWSTMGHLYKGGMWFKKKANIPGFTDAHIPNSTVDLRTSTYYMEPPSKDELANVPSGTKIPPISDMSQYFYLPALGYYFNGSLNDVGGTGNYYSSSAFASKIQYAEPKNLFAWELRFYKDFTEVTSRGYRTSSAFIAQKFSDFGED